MADDDVFRLLQKYGKATDNMRLLKQLLLRSSDQIATQDQRVQGLLEKISGLELEVRTLKNANEQERDNHKEEIGTVHAQLMTLKSDHAELSVVAAERETQVDRLKRELSHLKLAVNKSAPSKVSIKHEVFDSSDDQHYAISRLQSQLGIKTAELDDLTGKWRGLLTKSNRLVTVEAELQHKSIALQKANLNLSHAKEKIRRLEDDAVHSVRETVRLKQLAEEHRSRSDEFRHQLSEDIQRRLLDERNLVLLERSRNEELRLQLESHKKISESERQRAETLQTSLHTMRLDLATMTRLRENAEEKARTSVAEVQNQSVRFAKTKLSLESQLKTEQAELSIVKQRLVDQTKQLESMNAANRQLAASKMENLTLQAKMQENNRRLAFESLRNATTSNRVRSQIVKLTSALHEIQRRTAMEGSLPNNFESELLSPQHRGDSHFFSRTGTSEAMKVLQNAKKIIDFLQDKIAEHLYDSAEQLQSLVLESMDSEIDVNADVMVQDKMAGIAHSFKNALQWIASSELRLLTLIHDKLVTAFVSVAWTREINSKTMEMRLCALWNNRRRGHLLRAPPTVKNISSRDFEKGGFKERFWGMMGVDTGLGFDANNDDPGFGVFMPSTATSQIDSSDHKGSYRYGGFSGTKPGIPLPKSAMLQRQLFKIAHILAVSLRPALRTDPNLPSLVGMDRGHPNRQVLDLEFYALLITFVRVDLRRSKK